MTAAAINKKLAASLAPRINPFPRKRSLICPKGMNKHARAGKGFTLIELSIVLVIIGLIVGGVLVGQDLIRAAGVRAQISQIEKYNAAVNTFYGKYGYLPGDINAAAAAQFGFAARGQYAGQGDGNGLIEGISNSGSGEDCGWCSTAGETVLFWMDLSHAGLIEGSFTSGSATALPSGPLVINQYLPEAKIGHGNFVYVWSENSNLSEWVPQDNLNRFGISAITQLGGSWPTLANPGLTVQEAYSIDKKVDDGLPQAGRVLALYTTTTAFTSGPYYGWAGNGGVQGAAPFNTATSGSATTCYDNGNTAGAAQQYSVEISNGSNVNCALSFRMQAGD